MKWLIIICCLALASQYPPVKSMINDQIQRFNHQLDNKKEKTQQKEEAIKTQYMKQTE